MKWAPPRNDGGNPVKGYIVERREKAAKKKEWTKINRGEVHKVCLTSEFMIYVTILIPVYRQPILPMKTSQL